VGGSTRGEFETVRRSDQHPVAEVRAGDVPGEPPDLTIEQILTWADTYHAAHGAWPNVQLMVGLGPVDGAPGETWKAINYALAMGKRGLPGDSSLAELLAEHRGAPVPDLGAQAIAGKLWAWEQEHFPVKTPRLRLPRRPQPPPLTIGKILAWADAFHAARGRWPSVGSGPVADAPGETWSAIDRALARGRRGLPVRTRLAPLLVEHRGKKPLRGRMLSIVQILAWADAHHAATGRWPSSASGAIAGAPGETWEIINSALRLGLRGLPGNSSLAILLVERRGHRHRRDLPRLTLEQILAWADAHYAATGNWPTGSSGAVAGVPGATWRAVQTALFRGLRGLPGGTTLAQVLAKHRGHRNLRDLPELTAEQILVWGDAHRAAAGCWPTPTSGPVNGAPGETWKAIDHSLRLGSRGLPGSSSLSQLLAEHRGHRNQKALPKLTPQQILAWADTHHAASCRWPTATSGPVSSAPGETWSGIYAALWQGGRGLPRGSSLPRLLDTHRRRLPGGGEAGSRRPSPPQDADDKNESPTLVPKHEGDGSAPGAL
jgi:hypothetical protein